MEFTGERMVPEFNKEEEIYLEHMARYIFASQFVRNKVVLDIACGSGYGSKLLADAGAKKVFGVDISKEAIDSCKKNYKDKSIQYLIGDVKKIPLENDSIDIIVSFETIEHVDAKAQKKFLSEIERILKKDGLFVISTPNSLVYPKGNPYHIKELNLTEFLDFLKEKFANIILFYQDDVQSSYILSEKNTKREILFQSERSIEAKKVNTLTPLKSLYFIAVCSQSKKKNIIKESLTLFNTRLRTTYQQFEKEAQKRDREIAEKNRVITEREKKINKLTQEIEFMKSSKFWKMREIYLSIKKGLNDRKRKIKKF